MKDTIEELAAGFCLFYYQSRSGKISKENRDELEDAIIWFADLHDDLSSTEKRELEIKTREVIEENKCVERLREPFYQISKQIKDVLEEFQNNEDLGLTEDERYDIVCECDPVFLTSTIYNDTTELDKLVKIYYDVGKQTKDSKKASKSSARYGITYIVNIVQDYLILRSNKNIKNAHFYSVLDYEKPQKTSLLHLLRMYGGKEQQAFFKKIFEKDISLSKADRPIKRTHPKANEWEL